MSALESGVNSLSNSMYRWKQLTGLILKVSSVLTLIASGPKSLRLLFPIFTVTGVRISALQVFSLALILHIFTCAEFSLWCFDITMLVQDAGVEIDPLGDLSTEVERKLGQLVLEK